MWVWWCVGLLAVSATVTWDQSPSTGYRGTTETLRWTIFPVGGDHVRSILLLKSGNPVYTVASNLADNTLTLDWAIASNRAEASYQLQLVTESGETQKTTSFYIRAQTSSFSFSSPSSSQTFRRGVVEEIKWTTVGAIPKVDLVTTKGLTIATGVDNTGSYSWTVPLSLDGSQQIKISSNAATLPAIYDATDRTTSTFYVRAQESTFQVTSPSSSATWYRGETKTITWTSVGSIPDVDVMLTEGSVVIASKVANTGSYTWTLPDTTYDGTYHVKIVSHAATLPPQYDETSDSSSTFYIRPAPATLTWVTPGSSDYTLYMGYDYELTWLTDGDVTKVKLYTSKKEIIASVDNTGKYTWSIPTDWPASSQTLKVEAVEIAPRHGDTPSSIYASLSSRSFSVTPASITVTKPDRAVTRGIQTEIAWNTKPLQRSVSQVQIDILKDGTSDVDLTYTVANNGSMPWVVPTDMVLAASYEVRVTALQYNPVGITAAPVDRQTRSWSVSPQSLASEKITVPASNSRHALGASLDVKWELQPPDAVQKWTMEVINYSKEVIFTNPYDVDNNAEQKWTWTIPVNLPSDENLYVRLTAKEFDKNYGDEIVLKSSSFRVESAGSVTINIVKPQSRSTWHRGDLVDIEYTVDPSNVVQKWNMGLARSSSSSSVVEQWLATATPNNGSIQLIVPATVPASSWRFELQAETWDKTYGSEVSKSVNYITVSLQDIDIGFTSPASSAKVRRGDTVVFEWTVTPKGLNPLPASAAVTEWELEVYDPYASSVGLFTKSQLTTTRFEWKVPDDFKADTYQVKVTATDWNPIYGDPGDAPTTAGPKFTVQTQDIDITFSKPATGAEVFKADKILFQWVVKPGGVTPLPADQAVTEWELSINKRYSSSGALFTQAQINTTQFEWTVPADFASSSYEPVLKATKWNSIYGDPANPPTPATKPTFTVKRKVASFNFKSPDGQDTTWYLGRNYTIKWETAPDHSAAPKVNLKMALSGNEFLMTPAPIDNTGEYTYLVPEDTSTGSGDKAEYTLTLSSDELLPEYQSTSVTFVDKQVSVDIAKIPVAFEIQEPKLDELWNKTTASAIEWTTTPKDMLKTVKIELRTTRGVKVFTIADGLNNTGYHFWEVPVDIKLSESRGKEIKTRFQLVITLPTGQNSKYAVTDAVKNLYIGPHVDSHSYTPNLRPWDETCAQQKACATRSGDSFCACMRDCGRRCLPGYKHVFSGFDAISNELKGFVLLPEFNPLTLYSPDLGAATHDFWLPLGVTVQPENAKEYGSSSDRVTDYANITHDERKSYSGSFSSLGAVSGSTDAQYADLYSEVRKNDATIQRWMYKNPAFKITMQGLPKLNPFFEDALAALPAEYTTAENKEAYGHLINLYGTQYIQSAVVGEKVQSWNFIRECYARTRTSSELTAAVTASATVETGVDNVDDQGNPVPPVESETNQGGGESDVDKTDIGCLKQFSKSKILVKGGATGLLGCKLVNGNFECNGNWGQYELSKYESPYRLKMELRNISTLISDTTRRANWNLAVEDYVTRKQAEFLQNFPEPDGKPALSDCPCREQVKEETTQNAATEEDKEGKKKAFGGYVAAGVLTGVAGIGLAGGVKVYQWRKARKEEQENNNEMRQKWNP